MPANTAEINLQDQMLRAFESSICDNKGLWVFFDKIVPQDEEQEVAKGAPAKKAPAKGVAKAGTANAKDLKPTYAKGWINLIPLLQPGTT